jgi:hypothetical protein
MSNGGLARGKGIASAEGPYPSPFSAWSGLKEENI